MIPDTRPQLEPPKTTSWSDLSARTLAFLRGSWWGRLLLASAVLAGLGELGLPIPGASLASFVLWLYLIYGLFRFGRYAARRLLWRIRSKLIVSYLFVGVVPVVLLVAFFMAAYVIFFGVVASHLVSEELVRSSARLELHAREALVDLSRGAPEGVAAALERRLSVAREEYPNLAYSLVSDGLLVAHSGAVPRTLPPWLAGPAFAGLTSQEDHHSLRAVRIESDRILIVDVPVDSVLFADLERSFGIRLLSVGKGPEGEAGRDATVSGVPFANAPEATDWPSGNTDLLPLSFQYEPYRLFRRLTPGRLPIADYLAVGLAILGAVFVVVYGFALVLGLLLARSVTKSVHALSIGTERLREGDFGHRIQIRSRDQLGELAESFNTMGRGIEDLLREQTEKQRLEEELRIARQIQMSLLPQAEVEMPGLRVAALCLPAAEVGGDYYDLLPLSDGRMGVLIADVSGKGTSAALYMAELKGLVLSLSRICDSPARLLSEANRILAGTMDSRTFVTMTYAVVDTTARAMRYARAGHNPVIYLPAGAGRTRILMPPGLGLGMDPGPRFDEILEEDEIALRGGDVLLFFTDGLSEAMNEQAELYGEGRLRELIERSDTLSSDEIKERILQEIRGFVGNAAQHDDMTLVILKVL